MVIYLGGVTFSTESQSGAALDEGFDSELILDLVTPIIEAAPSAITVSIVDALGADDLVFSIDGREVFRIEPDSDGSLDLVSVPVPDLRDAAGNHIMQPGAHTLSVTQGTSYGEAEFTIIDPPAPVPELIGPDAPPAPVAGSIQPNGTRRWVFQDLMPTGLGSWVLPMNPSGSTSPPFTRNLTARTTTADETVGGRFHIYEDAYTPVEWTFEGYCPSEEMRELLESYADLNRRWYLHDHRGRAWKVTAQDLQLEPRLTQIWNGEVTNEGHDYKFTVLVMERDWTEV